MTLPAVTLPRVALPRLGLAAYQRRLLFRGAFALLAAATLALALALLAGEKERSYRAYQQSLSKTAAEIVAKLRHPAGQLALLNPALANAAATPLRPLLLPFGAIDFDDPNKARQAVETAGCSVQYPDGASLCVAVGNNPYAGGFIYLVGSFASGPLTASTISSKRTPGGTDLGDAHRARVTLSMRGDTTRWIAPFEAQAVSGAAARGRLTGFVDAGGLLPAEARPVRDFRGWLWQDAACGDAPNAAAATSTAPATADCKQRSFFSIRLPVDVFRDALFQKPRPVWPPPDLASIEVRFEMLAPGSSAALFDSNAPGATAPLSQSDLASALSPGETLLVRKAGAAQALWTLKGSDDNNEVSAPWLDAVIRKLPVEGLQATQQSRAIVRTAVGDYEVLLTGDLRSVDRALSVTATRMSWFIAAMLGAIVLAWLLIEIGLIRRIVVLTQRAAAVSQQVPGAQAEAQIASLDLTDLRGRDELGILAGGLSDLLQRVKDDVRRETIRAHQERELWHAVGHEIMSPLQSLMVLHPAADDASHRYVQRMQQAVRVLYGTASPGEALEAATLKVAALDLDAFLHNVAANAHFAGIDNVTYQRADAPVLVRADEFPLEDAVTHILRNAMRFRTPGTAIVMTLMQEEASASVAIHNQGPQIDPARLTQIFDYGVSGEASAETPQNAAAGVSGEGGSAAITEAHRGQGLFVAKTYMAKMGGTVSARNEADGVSFTLILQRAG